MKIKTRLYLDSAVVTGLLVLLVFTQLFFARSIESESERHAVAEAMVRGATDMLIEIDDHLAGQHPLSLRHWQATYSSLSGLTGSFDPPATAEIRRRLDKVNRSFLGIQSENSKGAKSARSNSRAAEGLPDIEDEKLSRQIRTDLYAVFSIASGVSRVTHDRLGDIRKNRNNAALLFVIALFGLMILHSTVTIRGVVRPLNELVKGVGIIERGHLAHPLAASVLSLDDREKNEITNLAAAFHNLTKKLVVTIENLQGEITEHKKAEEALLESEAHLRRAQEVAHSGSWELDLVNGDLFWSDKVYQILGLTREVPISYEYFLELVLPEDREYIDRTWQAALRGEPYDIEHRIRVNGEIKWLRERAELEFDGAGKPVRGVGIVQDITERRIADEQLQTYQGRLRALATELTLVEERERRRIATELHDGPAQSLAFARILLAATIKKLATTGQAGKLDEVSQTLRSSIQQIRALLMDLSSPLLAQSGLGEAVSDWLDEQIAGRDGLGTSFVEECGELSLDEDVAAVLFRNTRELLANSVKHARADSVSVRIETSGRELRITVEDDGQGFDVGAAVEPSCVGGFGLFSIQERMVDMGGSIDIDSRPGKGCKVTMRVPLAAGRE